MHYLNNCLLNYTIHHPYIDYLSFFINSVHTMNALHKFLFVLRAQLINQLIE